MSLLTSIITRLPSIKLTTILFVRTSMYVCWFTTDKKTAAVAPIHNTIHIYKMFRSLQWKMRLNKSNIISIEFLSLKWKKKTGKNESKRERVRDSQPSTPLKCTQKGCHVTEDRLAVREKEQERALEGEREWEYRRKKRTVTNGRSTRQLPAHNNAIKGHCSQ